MNCLSQKPHSSAFYNERGERVYPLYIKMDGRKINAFATYHVCHYEGDRKHVTCYIGETCAPFRRKDNGQRLGL